ncbi:Stk1 family PASTA domain-containing Ser/Thr kinase [Bacillus timonensis]|nr:Stk1 family PASTA domain-containing Ser/Thr kinase [Bacillus timonensis]
MLIGRRLNGRYKILEGIGGGGMANVYLAKDMILEREVAIKILRLDFSNDEEFIKRFRREAHSATSLAHPNIVSIYDVGEEGDIYYIVMEYVAGTTLKQYIQQHAPLHPREALNIMEQLASAISHAHQHQIIHRDIKPQNILIDHGGTVKITDFGIAVALSSTTITQTNSVLGSVHYLSPEQARGGMATRKSDIYSLGIVLFELITGRVPFSGESAVSIALKHLQSDTPSPKRWNPTIPQSVENIILKATAKDPFHRYDSVEEIEEDIHTALDPDRINEEKFSIPHDDEEITKAIPIITELHNHHKRDDTIVRTPEKKNADGIDSNHQKKKKRNKLPIILGTIFLLLIAAAVSAVTIIPSLLLPEDVTVPDVSNMEYEDAVKRLLSMGFDVEDPIKIDDETIPEGYIIRTNPKANEVVKEGTKITIYQSSGKKKIEFENYVGQDIEDVRRKLKDFNSVIEKTIYDESPFGTIIDQSIKEGKLVVPEETDIEFVVSKGPKKIKLRDLSRYNSRALDDYASEVGIIIDYTEEKYDETVEKGLVISQNPAAGTEIDKDQIVKVVISKGKEPKENKTVERQIEITYSGSEEGQGQKVQIFIQDANNSITNLYDGFTMYETTIKKITFVIKYGEKAKYLIFIDDKLFKKDEIDYPVDGQ